MAGSVSGTGNTVKNVKGKVSMKDRAVYLKKVNVSNKVQYIVCCVLINAREGIYVENVKCGVAFLF